VLEKEWYEGEKGCIFLRGRGRARDRFSKATEWAFDFQLALLFTLAGITIELEIRLNISEGVKLESSVDTAT
jgi:hypothetical protein